MICLIGCTSSDWITSIPTQNSRTYSQLDEDVRGETVTIVLMSGESISGEILQVRKDSMFWVNPKSKITEALPTTAIEGIRTSNHLLGALEGLGLGALAGTLIILADVGLSSHADDLSAPILIGLVGLAAPPVGLIIGAVVGHRYENHLDKITHDSTSTKTRSDKSD